MSFLTLPDEKTYKHRIVLTGGGTGGHIYPALSVHERLVKDNTVEAILYIGAAGHMEEALCKERQIDFCGLDVSGLPRKVGPRLLTWPFQTIKAVMEARRILGRFDPTCVLGTGGYASAPALLAANQLGVPIAVHEPDAHPGLVNRLFSKSAKLVSCGMEGALTRFNTKTAKVIVNGNPVRESFSDGRSKSDCLAELGLNAGPGVKTLAVTGGSQGAQAVNNVIVEILQKLLESSENIQVIHQAGVNNIDDIKEKLKDLANHPRYLLRPYFEDMAVVYKAADLAVSRAGAMTIAELAVTGTPTIFIPYPFAAQEHQMHNARSLEIKNAARVVAQKELSPEILFNLLKELFFDDEKLQAMKDAMKRLGKPDACENLKEQLKEISKAYSCAFTGD